ncbi:hypothetical protein E9229_001112 [Paeniglutamicibacter cryotolerans]|uniref:Uncharacterized protein n=1 Tax=Paeniglutamicibacter cryotolerans TaxID=670079 RepID=A0A839QS98_9MICC|nr:hypothetical protein [Paeniglutamicibacter cryotolerans]
MPQQLLAGPVQGDGVVVGLADIDTDEHVDGFMTVDLYAPHSLDRPGGAVSDETVLACLCGSTAWHPRYGRPWMMVFVLVRPL